MKHKTTFHSCYIQHVARELKIISASIVIIGNIFYVYIYFDNL